MSDRGAELLFGVASAVLAVLVLLRIGRALRTGEVPLYRTRLRRAQAGEARFRTLIAIYVILFVLLFFMAADLLLQLGFRSGR